MKFSPQLFSRSRGFARIMAGLGVGFAILGLAPAAHAVPSYARQTGSECAACHVGGFGPQLTPYGIKFKINGYTDTDGAGSKVPLSAMMVLNSSHVANDPSGSNDHSVMQEASVFVAGRLADNIGSFVQVTYSGVDKKSSFDQGDIRYARSLNLGDKDLTVGLSLNTNPTLTDPFNTLGQWRFPYVSSDYNAGLGPVPIIESLGGSVAGANLYAFLDNSIYAEFGLYDTLSQRNTDRLKTDNVGKFSGLANYWRLAYFKDRKRDNFSVGLIGFNAKLQPDRTVLGTPDKYRDLGVDAAYQYLGNRQHVFTANASYVREWQTLDFSAVDQPKNRLDQFRVATSYHYNQTWGGTVGLFASHANANEGLYPDAVNYKPNTSGYILQADWTPWGKESSWGAPWANVRLGIQYTGYNKFNGGSTYTVGGEDHRARDNNTTMLFLWTSI